jgi:hypothetical protein
MKYLIQADGKLPNLALMQLSAYFKSYGEPVAMLRGLRARTLFDQPGEVYGSSIFDFSRTVRTAWDSRFGPIHWGGTGVRLESSLSEVATLDWDSVVPDYSLYPEFEPSIGFTQRGCRLSCKFCVVPKKEGKPRSVATIHDIWRGGRHPKKVILLDNDFFGQEQWRDRIAEIKDGGFRVAFSQGVNVRQVDEESARALASIQYRDNEFKERVLYTAWDNLGDESIFKRGVDILQAAGVPAKHLRVYMLIGYKPSETFEEIQYRFNELVSLGCEPYPMVYDPLNKRLKAFQRWAITGLYRAVKWEDYRDPRLVGAK